MKTIHEHIESAKATFHAHFDAVKQAESSATRLAAAIEDLHAGAERLRVTEEENEKLRRENGALTLLVETLRMEKSNTVEMLKQQLARPAAPKPVKPATTSKKK
jgi:regulator of replication initiation timing